jgi:hypothetical protein
MKEAPGFGRLDATRMANEQRRTQVLLKLTNLDAKRRLGDMQLFSGTSHVAGIHYAYEILELAQIQDASPARLGQA